MTLRRKLAIATWDAPREGNIYGKLVLDARPALEYIERRRAETLLRVVRSARKLEVTSRAAPPQRERRLLAMRGLGPWTVSSIESVVMGDPDSVILGDYHIPNLVSYALGGEDRGDDAAMLALLEPFRPHRGRVIALLQASRMSPPRFGPRLSVRDIRSG